MFTQAPTHAAVIYHGPSMLDGEPIVVIATTSGRNRKTGKVVQTYILRADMDPRDANKSGADYSICGDCPHRGTPTTSKRRKLAKGRSCYVNIAQGVLIVWKSWKRGTVYPPIQGHQPIKALGAGKVVRLGTYGDPSAVPSWVWDSLIEDAVTHVGYTHQLGHPTADVRPDMCMISADSPAQAAAAHALGYRTFRVANSYADMASNEIACPSRRGVQCTDCRLCSGTTKQAKSIVIQVHGPGSTNFAEAEAA